MVEKFGKTVESNKKPLFSVHNSCGRENMAMMANIEKRVKRIERKNMGNLQAIDKIVSDGNDDDDDALNVIEIEVLVSYVLRIRRQQSVCP